MEINEKTLTVLQNFANINPNIMFDGTNVVKTMSEARNIVAKTTLSSAPEKSFGIYDLSEFLSTLSLLQDPTLKFEDKYVTIGSSSGRSRIKYFYSNPEMLTYPQKEIIMPQTTISFELTPETLASIKKAASTLGHEDLKIVSNNGSLELIVCEHGNSTANTFTIDVAGDYDKNAKFEFLFKIPNLKLLSRTYTVEISEKLISKFTSNDDVLIEYWIALEKDSVCRT